MSRFQVILGIIFIVFLWLPFAQSMTGAIKEPKLNGVQKTKVLDTTLSLSSLLDGSLQDYASSYFQKTIGFRKTAIKVNSTINTYGFREHENNGGTEVVLGKDLQLFEKGYIESFRFSPQVPTEKLSKLVTDIKVVQNILATNDIPLILLISPSKVSFHADLLPPKYKLSPEYFRDSSYSRMVPLLKNARINYIDSPKIVRELFKTEGTPVFPTSGTHWNYFSACRISSLLTQTINKLNLKNIAEVSCGPVEYRNKPLGADDDLLELLNIYSPSSFYSSYPYPTTHNNKDKNSDQAKANMLVIGSSYMWQVFRIIDKHKIYIPRDFYYYFTSRFRLANDTPSQINRDPELIWKSLMQRDAVVIEINEAVVDQAGFGFFELMAKWLIENRVN